MKVYQGIGTFEKIEKSVVTTGTFDGVHIGHRKILDQLIASARKIKGESVLLTFFPHPRMVLQEPSDLKLINTIEEKTNLLKQAGIDHLIIHPFTREFSRTTSVEFVRDILVNQLGTHKLVIGYDHHFGRNREGSFAHLKEYGPLYGFEVEEIPAQEVDEIKVSSTKIRKAIASGNMKVANRYLGQPFMISGPVVHGDKLGRKLGYPTANVEIKENYKLLPANGIYVIKAQCLGQAYQGMLNIGTRPTVSQEGKLKIEAHLFDFEEDIYGQPIRLELLKRLREEKTFGSKEELIAAMDRDKVKSQRFFQ
jgi:riboflavin kinase/FMN adenylyltransferase